MRLFLYRVYVVQGYISTVNVRGQSQGVLLGLIMVKVRFKHGRNIQVHRIRDTYPGYSSILTTITITEARQVLECAEKTSARTCSKEIKAVVKSVLLYLFVNGKSRCSYIPSPQRGKFRPDFFLLSHFFLLLSKL